MTVQRIASKRIDALLEYFPAVALIGPRQSGKTTLLLNQYPTYRYVSFDTIQMRALFEDDPEGFVQTLGPFAIIDEAQKAPSIFEWIKTTIDHDRRPGRFLLTGSAQFTVIKKIGESLAGRCGFQYLLPFQYSEIPGLSLEKAELSGFYPELLIRDWVLSREWYEAYVTTYVERDVRDLLRIGNLRDFNVVLGLLAARTSQELNFSVIARESGVSEKTIAAWVSVLEASFIIFLLKPWHRNLGKRLVKRPKLFFWDTGLVSYLCGLRNAEHLRQGPMAGALFENLVMADLMKNVMHRGLDWRIYYFRTNAGLELDFLIEDTANRHYVFGEIKRRTGARPEDTRNIRTLLLNPDIEEGGWKARGLIVYQGDSSQRITDRISAIGVERWLADPTSSLDVSK